MSTKMEIVDQYVKDSNLSLSEKSGCRMTVKTGFSTMYETAKKFFSKNPLPPDISVSSNNGSNITIDKRNQTTIYNTYYYYNQTSHTEDKKLDLGLSADNETTKSTRHDNDKRINYGFRIP